MSSKKTKSIWLYAVVLFTGAFIILLITAFSQIKLNRNLNDLNSQINTKENEKNQVQLSFANAQDLNGKLKDENKRLQDMIDGLNAQFDVLKTDKDAADNQNKTKLDAYEKLSLAESEYLKGNTADSAGIIKDIDPNLLNTNAIDAYTLLKQKVYSEAGGKLFTEGYRLYRKRDYQTAREKLGLSWLYAPDKESSDKCLYYLALSEAKTGDITSGVSHMSTLTEKFPKSRYLSSARRFIAKYPDIRP